MEELSADENFQKVVVLTDRQVRDGTREECVLRFFAYLNNYRNFKHIVKEFLNDYMESASKGFEYTRGATIFRQTFAALATAMPEGIVRLNKRGKTPLVLYEGVAAGAALAIQAAGKIVKTNVHDWLNSPTLRKFTTGDTNNFQKVKGRIEYCRDRFLGKPDGVRPQV